MRSGAQMAADALRAMGVSLVFGVPGGHNLPLFAAIESAGIRGVGARHEQGAGFLAEAHAKLTGHPAVVITTAGPGITNTLTPLAQAFAESVPICILALDNYTSTLAQPDGRFHAIADLKAAVSPFAHWVGAPAGPADVGPLVDRAMRLAADTSRPTVVQLPSDVLTATAYTQPPKPVPESPQVATEQPSLFKALRDLLNAADRPVILAGAGAIRSCAGPEIYRLATALHCPVVTTVQGRGVIADDHELALGPIWDRFGPVDEVARESDLVLCLGTSLSPLATREGKLPLGPTVQISLDLARTSRLYKPKLGIPGDVASTLQRFLEAHGGELGQSRGAVDFARWAADLADGWRSTFALGAPAVHGVLQGIREGTPRDAVFVCDMTVAAYWAQRFLPIFRPGGLLSPYYFGTLGYGVPAAIGAKLAAEQSPVIALCGDAGFLMNSQELATANLHGLAVHIIVINDGAYAAVHADERRIGLPRLHVSQLVNPDFSGVARAYGWAHRRVAAGKVELKSALDEAVTVGKSSITEVMLTERFPMPYEISW
jgi:thiamine pyrophosphate-dependent acetolactate synthase large subunit-like protein